VMAVAAIVRKNDLGIVVAKDLNAKTPKDLVDKNVKVLMTPGHMANPFLDALFRAGNADRTKVEFVNVGVPVQVSSYLSNVGGALVTTVAYYEPLLKTARPSNYIMFSDYGLELPGHGIIATTDTMQKKPDALRRYLAVLEKAHQYAWESKAHMEESIDAMIEARKEAKLDRDIEVARVENYKLYNQTAHTKGKPLLWMPDEDWAAATKAMIEAKLIPADSKPTDFYTNKYLTP
jgi:NitT/TauT family transport system substrate-binding protein